MKKVIEKVPKALHYDYRQMCSKLHLAARPSELDRIIYAFSNRYWASNLHELYGNAGERREGDDVHRQYVFLP